MIEDIVTLYRTLGIGASLSMGFFILFWVAGNQVPPVLRKRLSKYLTKEWAKRDSIELTEIISNTIDEVFGKKLFGIRSFSFSCIFSIVAMAVMILVYCIINWGDVDWRAGFGTNFDNIETFIIHGLVINLFVGYVSLLETRYIIDLMKRKRTGVMIGLVVVDLLATTIIVFLFMVPIASAYGAIFHPGTPDATSWIVLGIVQGYSMETRWFSPTHLGIYAYSTYVTSAWVFIYVAAALIIKTQGSMKPLHRVRRIQDDPFRSIGIIAIMLVLLLAFAIKAVI